MDEIIITTDSVEANAGNPVTVNVPASITKVQAMRIMKELGVWQEFKAMLATNEDAQDEWDLAISFDRYNPTVIALAPLLGFTMDQLDQLFIQGSQL